MAYSFLTVIGGIRIRASQSNLVPVGSRMTRQRQLILAQFSRPGVHLTADEVYERVRVDAPGISLATVYRNLNLLSQGGRIRCVEIGGGQRRYDGGVHRHYHVLCTVCGRMRDVPAEPFGDLASVAAEKSGFAVTDHELVFRGLCPDCERKTRRGKATTKAPRTTKAPEERTLKT